MHDKALDPNESLIASVVVQLSTWILAIFAIVIIALFLLSQGKFREFLSWICGGWKEPL